MTWQYIGVIVGAVLGFLSAVLAEGIRRTRDRHDRDKYGKLLLSVIVKEAEVGIDRCQAIVKLADKGRLSYSRIYTGFWDSTRGELLQYIEDTEVLGLLISIYYHFDLVNSNLELERIDAGVAFARQYLEEMQVNLSNLKARLNSS